jgi:hypothetical protein
MSSLFPDGIHPIGASVCSVELRTSYQPQVSRHTSSIERMRYLQSRGI